MFLDECVPEVIGDRLVAFLGDRPERPAFHHLLSMFPPGEEDRVWLTAIKETGWLVVTADRGKSNRGEKLPRLCLELGIIHVVLSATLHRRSVGDRALALAACWENIVEVWRDRIGCGHSLRANDQGPGFKLVDKITGRTRRPAADRG